MSNQRKPSKLLVVRSVVAVIILAVVVVITIIAAKLPRGEHINNNVVSPGGAEFNTMMSLLEYFNVTDSLDITWAHAANDKAAMQAALESDVMMLETDITLRGQGTANQVNIPVMAHPPLIDSDNTFADWLNEVLKTNKGMKLDFKSMDSVGPALDILNFRRNDIHQPVWLNMDILLGMNTNTVRVNGSQFVPLVLNKFPDCTLSLGWTTGWTNTPADQGYSRAMVDEMEAICRPLNQPVTFPLRAAAVKQSWQHIDWLLKQSSRYTLTIWSSKQDNVNADDMIFVRNNTAKGQVYYDLPEPLDSQFRTKLKTIENKS